MNKHHSHDYVVMFFIMILSGLFSTMNVWADKLDDIRFSLNDLYMIFLMTGWMFFFMGLYYVDKWIIILGGGMTALSIFCIRGQFLVSEVQYASGMIPHHSMAVFVSKKLIEKYSPKENKFVMNILQTQEKEIQYLKGVERQRGFSGV